MTSKLPHERCSTLVDLLRDQADRKGHDPLYRYLLEGDLDGPQDACSFLELDESARALGAWLQNQGLEGERALLVFPHGLPFVRAFFGCLYAGVVAVPAYPPHPAQLQRTLSRLTTILRDAQAVVVLSVGSIVRAIDALPGVPEELMRLRWVAVDEIPSSLAPDWRVPKILSSTLALLQYTSGSTSTPKGVMVSHGNILHNQRKLTEAMGHDLSHLQRREGELLSSWVPMFHDMGLIGMVLHPLFLGGAATFLSPLHFLRDPSAWLKVTSRLRTYMTGAPNFAYDLCVRAISEAERDGLDLSHLEIAFCSAETIRWGTLQRFASYFGPCGFRPEAFYHAYGLAEVSLFLCGGHPAPKTVEVIFVDKPALSADRILVRTQSDANVAPLLGCGAVPPEESLRIVHPQRATALGSDEVGEIWYQSPSVASGYWNQPALSARVFQARLADSNEGPYLRTGDLGFLHDGELYVTGRLKDLIILKGRNFYPQDMEQTVETCHPVLRPGCSVAFSLEVEDQEELVVLVEVRPEHRLEELEQAKREIAKSLWLHHDIDVWAVELLPRGAVHKTTSGKVQRRACRASFLGSDLPRIEGGSYRRGSRIMSASGDVDEGPEDGSTLAWMEERVSHVFREVLGRSAVGRDVHFLDLGGDSLLAVQIVSRLEESLRITLSLRSLIDHSTVGLIARFIVDNRSELLTVAEPVARIVPGVGTSNDPFPLTEIQQAYWIGRGQEFELGGVATHAYFEFDSDGLDIDRMEVALRKLVERHGALRTTFALGMQRVLPEVPPYEIRRRDLRDLDELQRVAALRSVRSRMSHRVVDPETWPLFEVAASRLTDGRTRLHMSWDMLVVDGWSLGILHDELMRLHGEPGAVLPKVEVTFRDFVCGRREDTARLDRARSYWLARADSLPLGPRLPLARAPGTIRRPRFERRSATLDAHRWSALRSSASRAGVTPSVALLSAFAATLSRWSRPRHFTLSLTFFNRPDVHPPIDRVVGDFTSLLLVEVDPRPGEDFLSFARRLQGRLWDDLQHRQFGGVELLREIARRRQRPSAFAPVVFTSMLGFPDPVSADRGARVLGEAVYGITQTPQVWLDHQVRPIRGGVQLDWDSVVGLFPDGMLEEMHRSYTALIHRLSDQPDTWDETSLDFAPERHRGHATSLLSDSVPGGLLHEGFLRQARMHPEAVAVRSVETRVTYGELNRIAGHYAGVLHDRGVEPNTLVGIVMEKGWEQPAAALAVLMAGAAFVPIDAGWPTERRNALLAQSDVRVVLTQPCVKATSRWPEGIEALVLEENPDPSDSKADLDRPISATDLAYVIFTSGSGGRPKGVMIDHRGAANTIEDINERFDVGPADAVLGVSSFSFDLSVYDVFGTLAAGGTLVLPQPKDSADPDAWLDLLCNHGVTLWNSVPSLLQLLVDRLDETKQTLPPSLRLALLSGDWIGMRLAHRLLREGSLDLISLGGATEASIWSIHHRLDGIRKSWTSIPYGLPLRHQTTYVLNSSMAVCPTWVTGEIFIGGMGVARGYWKEPELTRTSFVQNPVTGERLFRTGDLGRYLPDGEIEILGREDLQVKVRGHRIELAEVESVLRQHPSVRDCVVVVQGEGEERLLVAFVVCLGVESGSWVGDLRRFCESRVPAYMVPRAFERLDRLPLSANGKIDRGALAHRLAQPLEPAPLVETRRDGQVGLTGARDDASMDPTAVAEQVMTLIADVAGDACRLRDPDAVFGDYGFDSILGLRLRSRLEEAFGLRLPATLIWRYPTPRELIAHLTANLTGQGGSRPSGVSERQRAEDSARSVGPDAVEPLAILGMGCRLPGGDTPEEFWRSLLDGVDSVVDLAVRYADLGLELGPTPAWAGLLRNFTDFDAEFFGITPREAASLDPQQRMLLEVSWEALERAGIVPESLRRSATGVFLGAMYHDYQHLLSQERLDNLDPYVTTGSGLSFLAGRLSYFFGFEGPCMSVDTACSSSLVALHQACQSLRNGESDLALVGGVSLLLSPTVQEAIGRTQALSPKGKCKTFDAGADGFVRGEGCGVVVLKRLADARRDGDPILACVRGSAVNQDGRSTGLTAPNVQSQIRLHRQALKRAGVHPEQVTLIETHGTGTSLGDPIEVEALGEVYGLEGQRAVPCWLGALKTNIGHLEPAAGVAGVIKTVLAMTHGQVPRNLHFHALNPMVRLDERAFCLPRQTEVWRPDEAYAFAAVSSFGLSGTNAHVILGPAPSSGASGASGAMDCGVAGPRAPAVLRASIPTLIPLSARTTSALKTQVANVHEFVRENQSLGIQDIACALAAERTHFRSRMVFHANSREMLEEDLAALGAGNLPRSLVLEPSTSQSLGQIAFLFSGQGAQYAGMGRGLFDTEPVFAKALRSCAHVLDPLLPQPLFSVLFAGQDSPEAKLIDQTVFTQPALFALEYALFELWNSLGLRPFALLGHSVGELVAACVAGVFSLEDGLRLIAARGRLMQSLASNGAMASIASTETQVVAVIERRGLAATVSIAGCNAPQQTVISGVDRDVEAVSSDFAAMGIQAKRLPVSHAFHSSLMDPILGEFERIARTVIFHPPRIPVVSNLTGEVAGDELATPAYWVHQIRRPVRFAEGIRALWDRGVRSLVELGPHPVLVALGASSVPEPQAVHRLPSLRRKRDDRSVFLDSVARLYVAGYPIDWTAWYGRPRQRASVSLRTYPFERKRHWKPLTSRLDSVTRTQIGGASALDFSPNPPTETRGDFLEVSWREVRDAVARGDDSPVGRWLLLADRQGMADRLRKLVEAAGGRVVSVHAHRDGALAGTQQAVDPRSPQAVRSLLERVLSEGPVKAIVHLWGLDDVAEHDSVDGGKSALTLLSGPGNQGWTGALHLAHALSALQLRDPPRLVFLTRRAQRVEPSDPVDPEQALLWGLCGTFFTEYSECRCLRVDVSEPASRNEAAALFTNILDGKEEDQIALRQSRRYVPRLVHTGLPSDRQDPVVLRRDGTYVVTGGLGGLGFAATTWMASRGAGHLAVMGRRIDLTDSQKEAIAEMQRAGTKVTLSAVDVADAGQVEAALDQLRRDGPPLRGVVHTAGAFDVGLLSEQSLEGFQQVAAAKVEGGWNLHRHTAGDPLEFFILYSSVASLLGSFSLGPYAAANAFLDGLAHFRRSSGLVATSINWASFHDIGLATHPEWQRYRFLNQGVRQLDRTEGNRVLEAVLRTSPVQLGAARLDTRKLVEVFPQVSHWPYLSELVDGADGSRSATVSRSGDAVLLSALEGQSPRIRLEVMRRHIQKEVAEVMRMDPEAIDADVALLQLGLDSLMSMEIRSALESSIGKVLPPTLVWTYPTVDALAQRCLELLDHPQAEESAIVEGEEGEPSDGSSEGEDMSYEDALQLIDEVLGKDRDE